MIYKYFLSIKKCHYIKLCKLYTKKPILSAEGRFNDTDVCQGKKLQVGSYAFEWT